MSARPLPAYQGKAPYIFVTYSHDDAKLVHPQIRWLQEQGFNVWWDEGINPGAAWRQELADAISRCSLLLYFVTPKSAASDHCTREVNFALDDHHKPILAVHLVETLLPGSLALSLSDRQAILYHALDPLDYERKLATAAATYLNQPVAEISSASPRRIYRSRIPLLFAVACLAAAAPTTALLTWLSVRVEPRAPSTVSRFALDLPAGVSLHNSEATGQVSISGDGRRVVYPGRTLDGSRIYVRDLGSLESVSITGTEGGFSPHLSPDGASLMFLDSNDASLKRVSVSGGRPMTVIEDVGSFGAGLSWGRDGSIIFSGYDKPLMRISETGGTPEPVSKHEPGQFHGHPHLLDDGSAILFDVSTRGDLVFDQIAVVSLAKGEQRLLIQGSFPLVTSTDHLLFVRNGRVWATGFDRDRLEVFGEAVPVLDDVSISRYGANMRVADNGSMVYVPKGKPSGSLFRLDLDGSEVALTGTADRYLQPRISPDGRRVAVRVGKEDAIWIYDIDRDTAIRLTEAPAYYPLWSPTGETLMYSPEQGGPPNLHWRAADGTGVETRLTHSLRRQWATSWSQIANQALYFECDNILDACDLGRLSLTPDLAADLFLQTEANERYPMLSPDARWVAYESDRSGEFEVYVRPYPNSNDGLWKISIGGGNQPLWSPSGGEIYYTKPSTAGIQLMAVAVETAGEFVVGEIEHVVSLGHLGLLAGLRNHDLHPNGQFIVAKPVESAIGLRPILVQNWLDEVKAIVPKD